MRRRASVRLFGQNICDALRSDKNHKSGNAGRYKRAADTLSQPRASWDALATAFAALDAFITDRKSHYESFEDRYRKQPSSDDWADPRLKAVLSIFRTPNGVRTFQEARDQHSVDTTSDYAEDIVEDPEGRKTRDLRSIDRESRAQP